MKKNVLILLVLILAVTPCLLIGCTNHSSFNVDSGYEDMVNTVADITMYADENSDNIADDPIFDDKQIVNIFYTTDARGLNFIVYDLAPAGYAIYAITKNGDLFIEGSESSNSIYYGRNCEEIYYGGIGEYSAKINGEWYDLLYNQKISAKPTICMGFNIDDSNEVQTVAAGSSTPDKNKTETYNEFTCIENNWYFRTLSEFPKHVKPGSCGVVAVSMLLGYYQYYCANKLIINSEYRRGKGTTDKFAEHLFYSWVWDGKSLVAEGTIFGVYEDDPNADNPGFPMAATENKALITKYTKSISYPYIKSQTASIFSPKNNIKKQINVGRPCIASSTKYKLEGDEKANKSYHNIIVYGYQGDKFLCHMGWGPGSTYYADTIVSDLSIYSYYCLEMDNGM